MTLRLYLFTLAKNCVIALLTLREHILHKCYHHLYVGDLPDAPTQDFSGIFISSHLVCFSQ